GFAARRTLAAIFPSAIARQRSRFAWSFVAPAATTRFNALANGSQSGVYATMLPPPHRPKQKFLAWPSRTAVASVRWAPWRSGPHALIQCYESDRPARARSNSFLLWR